MTNLNQYIDNYKAQLEAGDVQKVYKALMDYMMSLKSHFQKQYSDKYSFGYLSPGYMDYTYFPMFDEYMQKKKLRFGIVLNHKEVRFELWLLGRNVEIQKKYWEFFKLTKWNEGVTTMPKYSIFETVLVNKPNFENLDFLSQEIEIKVLAEIKEVIDFLEEKK